MEIKKEYFRLDVKHKGARAGLYMVDFNDNGSIVLFIPSLNLSAYGKTKQEALTMLMDIVFDDYFENLLDLPEDKIFAELKSKGWTRSSFFKKELSKTAHVDREGILKDFNLPEETELRGELISV